MDKKYRQNVGAVIIKNNLLWAGKRLDSKNDKNSGWQFPQGGIEDNENSDSAIYREILEETGIKKDKIKLLKKMDKSLKYDFPPEVIKKNIFNDYCGQEQYWYIFKFLGNDSDINLNSTNEQEFITWEWKTDDFMIKNIVEFKKCVYIKLINWMKNEKLII